MIIQSISTSAGYLCGGDYVIKIYVDIDEFGNIKLPYLCGARVIPDKDYDYELIVSGDFDIDNLHLIHRVVDGELVKKPEDEIPEIEEIEEIDENEEINEPLTLEKLQQEQEMLALAMMDLAEIILNGGDE